MHVLSADRSPLGSSLPKCNQHGLLPLRRGPDPVALPVPGGETVNAHGCSSTILQLAPSARNRASKFQHQLCKISCPTSECDLLLASETGTRSFVLRNQRRTEYVPAPTYTTRFPYCTNTRYAPPTLFNTCITVRIPAYGVTAILVTWRPGAYAAPFETSPRRRCPSPPSRRAVTLSSDEYTHVMDG
jgi:hypothetical protein